MYREDFGITARTRALGGEARDGTQRAAQREVQRNIDRVRRRLARDRGRVHTSSRKLR
jgi:hypothetical protein